MKIHFISIPLLGSLHCNGIVITKFSFSYHYYAHYAVIKRKTLFFLLILKLISPLRLLRQYLEKLHIFISLLLLHSLQRDSDKKILFWFSPLLFFYYIHVFYYLHHVMIKIIFFFSFLLLLHHDQKKKITIWLLLPWPRVKTYFFHLVTTFKYAMVKRILIFIAPLLWLRYDHEKNVLFLFHLDVHYGNVFLHDLTSTYYAHTSLSCRKNSQMIYSPEKTCVT